MFFSLHCSDFIKGLFLYHSWSDQPEIWRTGSRLIGLKSERCRSDLESRIVVFQYENSAYVSGF